MQYTALVLYPFQVEDSHLTGSFIDSHNKLSSLVDISFPDLLSLDIRNNAIRALPILSAAFPGLQKLTADRNPLSELNLGSLSDLVELSAEKCQLRSEPSELENCVLLTKLYLASNKIGAFTNVQVNTELDRLILLLDPCKTISLSILQRNLITVEIAQHLDIAGNCQSWSGNPFSEV